MNVQKTELLSKTFQAFFATGAMVLAGAAWGQTTIEYQDDPVTGNIYRKTTQTVLEPVTHKRIERQEQMVSRPEVVQEVRPEVRTTYLPVTQMKWMPYVEGRWNPFRQPRVAYHPVPQTHWEARSEVVNRTTARTQWVREKRVVEIPVSVTRYQQKQRTDYKLVATQMPAPTVQQGSSNIDPQVAARLRPMTSPSSPVIQHQPTTMVASNTVGRATSDQPVRNSMQSGLRANVLQPAVVPGTPLPALGGTTTIATVPSFSTYR